MATQQKTMSCPEEACTTPPCECSCAALPRARARFFTGRFLTARDLRDEQRYVLSRLRLRNRLFHGWGVVCGLQVEPHPRPECSNWVLVKPGIAIDCCGREIFVCRDSPVEFPKPKPEQPEKPEYQLERPSGPEQDDREQRQTDYAGDQRQDDRHAREEHGQPEARYREERREGAEEREQRNYPAEPVPCAPDEPELPEAEWGPPYVVCLRYVECLIEPGPILVDEECCEPGAESFNRVREGFRLEVVALKELGEDCWPGWRGKSNEQTPCPCGDEGEVDCFEPQCPCDDCVPLALLRWNPRRREVVIDMLGRPRVPSTHQALTRIVDINWRHGGRLSVRDLRQRNNRLEITFSRPLRRTEDLPRGVGISRHTFVVTYHYGSQKDAEFLPSEGEPYLDESGCKAIFQIRRGYVGGEESIEGAQVHVALKGDFLPDIHGNALDANHLNGLLPSGNGVAGDTFESWFRVGAGDQSREETSR